MKRQTSSTVTTLITVSEFGWSDTRSALMLIALIFAVSNACGDEGLIAPQLDEPKWSSQNSVILTGAKVTLECGESGLIAPRLEERSPSDAECDCGAGFNRRVRSLFGVDTSEVNHSHTSAVRWWRGQQQNYVGRNRRLSNMLFGWMSSSSPKRWLAFSSPAVDFPGRQEQPDGRISLEAPIFTITRPDELLTADYNVENFNSAPLSLTAYEMATPTLVEPVIGANRPALPSRTTALADPHSIDGHVVKQPDWVGEPNSARTVRYTSKGYSADLPRVDRVYVDSHLDSIR